MSFSVITCQWSQYVDLGDSRSEGGRRALLLLVSAYGTSERSNEYKRRNIYFKWNYFRMLFYVRTNVRTQYGCVVVGAACSLSPTIVDKSQEKRKICGASKFRIRWWYLTQMPFSRFNARFARHNLSGFTDHMCPVAQGRMLAWLPWMASMMCVVGDIWCVCSFECRDGGWWWRVFCVYSAMSIRIFVRIHICITLCMSVTCHSNRIVSKFSVRKLASRIAETWTTWWGLMIIYDERAHQRNVEKEYNKQSTRCGGGLQMRWHHRGHRATIGKWKRWVTVRQPPAGSHTQCQHTGSVKNGKAIVYGEAYMARRRHTFQFDFCVCARKFICTWKTDACRLAFAIIFLLLSSLHYGRLSCSAWFILYLHIMLAEHARAFPYNYWWAFFFLSFYILLHFQSEIRSSTTRRHRTSRVFPFILHRVGGCRSVYDFFDISTRERMTFE